MAGAPVRFNDGVENRLARFDARFEDLEKNLLDQSARRIHDFERRLEHEWIALRQLHEEPLKTFELRTTALAENCLQIVSEALVLVRSQAPREPEASAIAQSQPAPAAPILWWHGRGTIAALFVALAALTVFSAYTFWAFSVELRDTAARATAAEERLTRLQQRVDTETREAGRMLQRVTAEATTSAARAERLANVLAAPDVRAFPMRGQRTAAAADGQMYSSASRGVALSGAKLPPLSANQTYQVWLVTTRGSIGLGFVVPDAQGRVSAAFDTPRDLPGSVTGFMLSLEPTGGNAKPTGPIVLAS
jgi:hypothetical protein